MDRFTMKVDCPSCGWGPMQHRHTAYKTHSIVNYKCLICGHHEDVEYELRKDAVDDWMGEKK
jgi:transcription elongation factor Elf1